MCCRFLILEEHYREILKRLGVDASAQFLSRYNVAPGSNISAIRTAPRASARVSVALHWGLVPSWAKSDDDSAQLVNARAETLAAKPSFRDAVRARRCVIPASGFYEWEHRGRVRVPWLFRRRDDQPFGLAGLWESWRSPDGRVLESCTVVTTEPNALMRPIHHRMPAMLTPAQCEAWLDPRVTHAEQLAPLLQPVPADEITATALGSRVSNVRHDDPACLTPAGAAADDDALPQLNLNL